MISIIIPVYKTEAFIDRCIKSVVQQKFTDFELILIDDGSPDNSSVICKQWEQRDDRIRYFYKSNGGVSSARNYGLDMAKGEYITFIDSDDWVDKYYLSTLFNNLCKYDSDISCCNFYTIDVSLNKKLGKKFSNKLISYPETLNCYSDYYYSAIWGKLFKKNVIENVRFDVTLKYSEDTLFYTEALFFSNNVYWDCTPLYFYFLNLEGAMNNIRIDSWMTDIEARKKIVDLYRQHSISEDLIHLGVCRAVDSAITILWYMKRNKISDKEAKRVLRQYLKENFKLYLDNGVSVKNKIIGFICLI